MTELETNNDPIFDKEDFVLIEKTNENGEKQYVGGGYIVKSFFMEKQTPILTTFNTPEQHGGKVSSPFENLAVPAGLFYINQRVPKNSTNNNQEHYYKKHEPISDDIMDKLFGLVEANKKQSRKTRKRISKTNKNKSKKHH